MIDGVENTMARMAAIQQTIAGGGSPETPLSLSTASVESMRSLLAQATRQLAARSGILGAGGYDLSNTAWLTPRAGPVRAGAPPGMEGFENGRLPTAQLVPIQGTSELLWAPAASALGRMRSDAARAGVDLGISGGYRSYEGQARLADELGLYTSGGRAAVPGTSQHGWGRAVDLDVEDQGIAWLRSNAWKYGFVETVPREPWHWEFHPAG